MFSLGQQGNEGNKRRVGHCLAAWGGERGREGERFSDFKLTFPLLTIFTTALSLSLSCTYIFSPFSLLYGGILTRLHSGGYHFQA